MRSSGENIFIWSDEKMLTNSQNDRFLAKSIASITPGARIAFRRMNLASMMIWAAFFFQLKKISLVSFEEGVKVNSEVYVKMLHEHALPWLLKLIGSNYIFTQDGALSPT